MDAITKAEIARRVDRMTELINAEIARQESYEATLNVATNKIPRLEALVKRSAQQVALLDAMLKQAEELCEVITVNRLGTVTSVRANLIALMTEARADQQRQLAEHKNALDAEMGKER